MNKTEFRTLMKAGQSPDPWAEAQKIEVIRGNGKAWPREAIDPGVNFFVLMLEHLGAADTASRDAFYEVLVTELQR